MEVVELVVEIAPLVLSLFATIVAFVKGKKEKPKKTIEEIAIEAKTKGDKYFEKECKKNKIDATQIVEKE